MENGNFSLAFSLIELIVVIAIVAILSAVAVPLYKDYKLKILVSSKIALIKDISDYLQKEYDTKGAFPTPMKVYGVSVPINSWTLVNNPQTGVFSLHYFIVNDGKGSYISVNFSGLEGMPGYITPTTAIPTGTAHSVVVWGIRDFSGTLRYTCGMYNGLAAVYVPFEYLPSSCQCSNILNFATNGTIIAGCQSS